MANFFASVDVDAIVPLTMQQVFDNALNGVVKQGCFSIDLHNGGCFYNSREIPNVHCGIGHSIPAEWEVAEESLPYLLRHDNRVAKLFLGLPFDFLLVTQSIHDMAGRLEWSMDEFKEGMKKLAEHFPLTYTEPTT